MATSFYRKYRPQTVGELDLDLVREFFERILKAKKTAHAYLFTGPKGTGKTSAARILAKVVNCDKGFGEPCNQCDSCRAITNGSLMDVLEIDAASNRGIDDIRDLREKIGLAPVSSKYKVYIIDEVHMLTMEAFNALLKTLEEPPEHAMFILATTEAHKVPETIVSRCTRVNFPQAGIKEVVRSLDKAVKGEKLTVEAGVLEEIAAVTEGSFREAMKILEQLALSGKKIGIADVTKEVGTVSVGKLVKALIERDGQAALAEVMGLSQSGANWGVGVRAMLEILRQELLALAGVEGYKRKFDRLDKGQLLALVEAVQQTGRELREAPIPELPLEVLVVEWCEPNSKLKTQNSKLDEDSLKTSLPSAVKPVMTARPKRQGKVSLEEVMNKWREVLAAVKPANHSLEGLLRSTKPVEVDGDTLRIEVFYKFHLDQLKQGKFLQVVEAAIGNVLGTDLRLEYFLGQRPVAAAVVENVTADVADEDIVKAAEEIFGA